MKKGARLNKAEEIIHKFSRNRDFMSDVQEIRRALRIPVEGFHDEAQKDQVWSPSPDRPTLVEQMEHAIDLCKKYKISASYNFEIRQLILFDTRAASDEPADYYVLEVDDGGRGVRNKEKMYRKFDVPYVKLFVLDASSKERVIELVRKNWLHIQAAMKIQGGSTSRVRTSENKLRNYRIASLGAMTKEELASILGISTHDPLFAELSRIDMITRILNEEDGYNIQPETVRKYLANPVRNLSTDKSRTNRIRRRKRK